MIKKYICTLFIIFVSSIAASAYQDCIVINNAKLTNINIEDNTIIDVYPLITVMNEKDTLVVHPLKVGKTRFCVLKNDKSLALFEVTVDEFETNINAPEGFEVLALDSPTNEIEFDLDEPPIELNTRGGKS